MVGAFFPTPYPDELYYSILCRYFVRSASASSTSTVIKLFGGLTVVSTTLYYPTQLNCIEKWVPPESGITDKMIIEKHTLYPYLLLSDIYDIYLKAEIPLDLFYERKARIMAGKIKLLPEYLRFCPICAEDDMSVYGETFWRRIHQLPGVVYCTVHKTRLINSSFRLKSKPYTLFPASDVKSDVKLQNIPAAKEPDNLLPYKESFLVIAYESAWLLQHGLYIDRAEKMRRKYILFLKEKGIGMVYGAFQESLSEHLHNYWGTGFLDSLFSEISDDAVHGFFKMSFIYNFKPIHHILVMCFLKGSLEKFNESLDNKIY